MTFKGPGKIGHKTDFHFDRNFHKNSIHANTYA